MNEHISQMLDTLVLDRLWDAHGNNTTLCSLIVANIIENYNPSTHYLTNPLLNVVNFKGIYKLIP